MTKVVIVGEIYEQNVQVGGGPMPGGGWDRPVDPGYGRPIFHPGHPDHGLPSAPGHPANRPPGSWGGPVDPGWGSGGGEYPNHGLPGSPGHPSGQPIVPPQGGTDVPESEYQPLPPPEDIYSQVVVSVWDPKTATWTTKSYPPR